MDLYPSERRWLEWLTTQAASVLDVGCATGGFLDIWREYRHDVRYTGVDISESLISLARRLHPGVEFVQADCVQGLPLADGYADLVQALGWLHWEPEYRTALHELWRLSRRYLFFDVRLVAEPGQTEVGTQRLALATEWDGKTTTPYVTVAWSSFAALVMDFRPSRVLAYGYWGKPADTVVGITKRVCFATFVLEKPLDGNTAYAPRAYLDLPLGWPSDLEGRATLCLPERLDAALRRPGQ